VRSSYEPVFSETPAPRRTHSIARVLQSYYEVLRGVLRHEFSGRTVFVVGV
jgi:hypothetical protein